MLQETTDHGIVIVLEIVDIDKEPERGAAAHIRGVPTTVISVDGIEQERIVGQYAIPQLLERLTNGKEE